MSVCGVGLSSSHTSEALYLGRAKRIASPAQRIMLLSQHGGCTFPGYTVSGYGTQVHHVNGWAKDNGHTNIDEMVLACGPDNRLAEGDWTARIRNGTAQWIRPPKLDTGQTRTNFYHHPNDSSSGPRTERSRVGHTAT